MTDRLHDRSTAEGPSGLVGRGVRGWLLAGVAALVGAGLWAFTARPAPDGPGVLLVVPAQADPLTERLADSTATYLGTISGQPVTSLRVGDEIDTLEELQTIAAEHHAGLVVVLEADRLAADRVDADRMAALGEHGFVLETVDAGDWRNALGDEPGATFVLTAGPGRLPRQYAAYELLRRLGTRFFHPEQEYVPVHAPADLRDLARRPTALHREGGDYTPDFASRSFSFHASHPLEHLEAFAHSDHPIDEAVHVNDWIVKNFGDRFRDAGRGAEPERSAELHELRQLLGFPHGVGISLHNLQQGHSADIDEHSGIPVRQQLETLVAKKLEESPDAHWFGIHFGATEFTTTPDEETVQWINWAGQAALRLRPELDVSVNVHITGRQPSPHFDDLGCPNGTNDDGRIDYYDLVFHTDPRLRAGVHTVMFYPLEGPARVYAQQSFAHKLCLMQKASAQGRPLTWFPEGSWWLSFDNPIPVYLPLYMWTRARDLELLRPLLRSRGGGTLDTHRMFDSGHEWGYWQQDYAVALMTWNVDVTLPQVLGEIFDPLCEPAAWREGCAARSEAIAVLQEVMEHQRELLLRREDFQGRPGGIYAYFAGEDHGDRIAAESGMEFRPVRVAFSEVMRWDQAAIDHFRRTDLLALQQAATAYDGWRQRLSAIGPQVPEPGRPWLDEVIDGVEIDGLRASQAAHLYDAVLSLRETKLAGTDAAAATTGPWRAARDDRARAQTVIRRREASYRYPPEQTHGGGLTPDTAVANGTTYPYRVHTKTHLLTYWNNRHDEVKAILEGADEPGLRLSEAIDAPGSALSVQWPQPSGEGDAVTIGPHAADPSTTSVALGTTAGLFEVRGTLTLEGKPVSVVGAVVRSAIQATTPKGGLTLRSPDDRSARKVLGTLVPSIRWAWVDEPAALVLAPDPDADGSVSFDRLVKAPIASRDAEAFVTEPVTLTLPVALGSGGTRISITLTEVVLRGRLQGDRLVDPLAIEGRISIPDLVHAAIVLAGFDEPGTHRLLAGIWGFDANDPPATAPIEAELHVVPGAGSP
ncbi:hypothetical protein [Paraliomyxa miuraensis]|uniref:hypothetical protein n=1 Tax=Paraliomyxa miuraensis TaxID=376150 RepID=UPI00224FA735|nr:hypothetical protein [Paraliomyxa miuraensis]MCX4244148.1 hypothetical protein [Paraliomyxa miuraensis]